MGIRTGNPRGRPKGAKNKRTVAAMEKAEKAAEAIQAVMPGAFDGDAHSLLMLVYKDPQHEWNLRIDAAKAAIRYEKPALSTTEVKAQVEIAEVSADPIPTEAEWQMQYGHG